MLAGNKWKLAGDVLLSPRAEEIQEALATASFGRRALEIAVGVEEK